MESETPSGVRTARTARKKMTRTRKASKKMRRGKVWRMNETDVSKGCMAGTRADSRKHFNFMHPYPPA